MVKLVITVIGVFVVAAGTLMWGFIAGATFTDAVKKVIRKKSCEKCLAMFAVSLISGALTVGGYNLCIKLAELADSILYSL